MTVGASLFCLVAGAFLTFAIETDSAEGINFNNIGVILMVIGLVGLAVYALFWGRGRGVGPTATVVDERPVVREVVEVRDAPVVERVRTRPVVERRTYR